MNPNRDQTPENPPVYSKEMAREAKRSEQWHRGALIGLAITIAGYLITSFISAPRFLEITFVVAAFVFAMAYMGTTIWVYSLRTERKRSAKRGQDEGETNP